MRLELVTAPAVEPLTLAEAKEHLRVETDFTKDDNLITNKIKTAREKVESMAKQSLINTTFDFFLDGWPGTRVYRDRVPDGPGRYWGRVIELPVCPLVSVTTITYLDASDTEQTLSPSTYRVSTGKPGIITLKRSESWPTAPIQTDAIRVRYVAGYGATGASVPSCLKDAMLYALGCLYENRGEEDAAMSRIVRDLIAPALCGRRP